MGTIAEGERNKMLDAWAGRGAYSANAAVYVQLHLGDPGVNGTSNKAVENTRKAATFGSAASAGAISNTGSAIEWTNVAASETYSHVSCWTTATDGTGTFLGSDQLNADAVMNAGDTFRLPVGDLDINIT